MKETMGGFQNTPHQWKGTVHLYPPFSVVVLAIQGQVFFSICSESSLLGQTLTLSGL